MPQFAHECSIDVISKIFKFFHTLWTNENETWKIEKLKNPGNRFSTNAHQIIGCNKNSMRPRKKNFTSWNNWNIELSIDTLVVKIERKLFPQLLITNTVFLRHPVYFWFYLFYPIPNLMNLRDRWTANRRFKSFLNLNVESAVA